LIDQTYLKENTDMLQSVDIFDVGISLKITILDK